MTLWPSKTPILSRIGGAFVVKVFSEGEQGLDEHALDEQRLGGYVVLGG